MIPRNVQDALDRTGVEMRVIRHERKIESVALWAPTGMAFVAAEGAPLTSSRHVYRNQCWGSTTTMWACVAHILSSMLVPATNKERARSMRRRR